MTTINMHMKFEIEIPKQTWLTSQKPCHLQSPETEKSTLGSRIAIPVRQLILTFFSHRYDAYSGQYVN